MTKNLQSLKISLQIQNITSLKSESEFALSENKSEKYDYRYAKSKDKFLKSDNKSAKSEHTSAKPEDKSAKSDHRVCII